MATANVPSTAGEVQLYKVLERANLLQYYDNFIAQGGDDVQQLCEAEEGEFFEIMDLVGMASKPLHVRRLQKALQEWISSVGNYQDQPVSPNVSISQDVSDAGDNKQSRTNSPNGSTGSPASQVNPASARTFASLAGLQQYNRMTYSPKLTQMRTAPNVPTENATMSEEHVENVRKAAEVIAKELDITAFPMPKKIPTEMANILDMARDDPAREPEIRKWAPIYGRFDSKRKSEKPLSLHEVTVNEAACQLCLIEPHLLFMRDRLFPLSRQVVRESGYQYKHGHSRSTRDVVKQFDDESPAGKRQKILGGLSNDQNTRTVQAELQKIRREERMNEISSMLAVIKDKQASLKDKISEAKMEVDLQKVYDLQIELEKLTSQQLLLMTEQTDLIKRQRRSERYYKAKAGDDAEGKTESEFVTLPKEPLQAQDLASSSSSAQIATSVSNGVYTVNPTAPPNDSPYMNGSYSTEGNFDHTSGQDSPRTASPRPESTRASRRKGTPAKSNQELHKQTLIDEGLRLAAVYNAEGEVDYEKDAPMSLHSYKDEDCQAVDAMLTQEIPGTVPVNGSNESNGV